MLRKSAARRSVLSPTQEGEFQKHVANIKELEESSKKLYKATKVYIASNNALGRSTKRLSQDLLSSPVYHQDPRLKGDVENWDNVNGRFDQHLATLNTCCQKCVVDPMKKLHGVFPSVHAAIKKRDQSLQEYNKLKLKLDKYQERERTGPNIVKVNEIKKSTTIAKEDFDHQNSILSEDLPTLYVDRTHYIEPCLHALISSQIQQTCDSYNDLCEVATLAASIDDYQNQIHDKLSKIKSLSITVDD